MWFADWKTHKKTNISKTILWEYDLSSPSWDWNKMKNIVVRRVLESGLEDDYYAMLQMYGGFEGVKEIVKKIPYLGPRERSWACVLFDLKKEELWSFTRIQLRKKLLNS